MEFNYAHNDTSVPERPSRTAAVNKLNVSDEVAALRKLAFEKQVPIASDETLAYITTLAMATKAKNILEVGSAVGITALALLQACEGAHITTIERDEQFFKSAQENLKNYENSVTFHFGDALEIVPNLPDDEYDFIFLDCAKVQYIKLLPALKQKLKVGGVLLADDVLLYGWVNGESPVPKKRKMLVEHVREYIDAVNCDPALSTTILDIGDGLSFSVKKF
jgi:predicted O-methyltransferase YrrM